MALCPCFPASHHGTHWSWKYCTVPWDECCLHLTTRRWLLQLPSHAELRGQCVSFDLVTEAHDSESAAGCSLLHMLFPLKVLFLRCIPVVHVAVGHSFLLRNSISLWTYKHFHLLFRPPLCFSFTLGITPAYRDLGKTAEFDLVFS